VQKNETLRVLIIGAHPDDCDIRAGGVAAKYARAGHQVRMVSLTNGAAGHQTMDAEELALRRREEAAAAGAVLGAEYLVLDYPDSELQPSLEARADVVRLLRRFRPDLVMAPRPWDYHPDHRATAQLVIDAMYLATVPLYVPDEEHLSHLPAAVYVWDNFKRPYPFTASVVVTIDDVLDTKLEALHCHTSQMYEWLPYNRGVLDQVPADEEARKEWLREWIVGRFGQQTKQYRTHLAQRYGPEIGRAARVVEAFEASEYGAPLSDEDIARLFPF
jgi:N-acetylglucosamine malate deacetylase 1